MNPPSAECILGDAIPMVCPLTCMVFQRLRENMQQTSVMKALEAGARNFL
jgi:hypothetical protein